MNYFLVWSWAKLRSCEILLPFPRFLFLLEKFSWDVDFSRILFLNDFYFPQSTAWYTLDLNTFSYVFSYSILLSVHCDSCPLRWKKCLGGNIKEEVSYFNEHIVVMDLESLKFASYTYDIDFFFSKRETEFYWWRYWKREFIDSQHQKVHYKKIFNLKEERKDGNW